MLFLTLFGVAWRRQNRLIYERMRMDELIRLEEVERQEQSPNAPEGEELLAPALD